jgi:phosphoribosyl-dephospho-CoA transferase
MSKRELLSASRYFPHDLLVLREEESFVSGIAAEIWVDEVLRETRTVAVRRGPCPGLLIPTAVQGKAFTKPFAGFVAPQSVLDSISPEVLVEKQAWQPYLMQRQAAVFRDLDELDSLWSPLGVIWGPVGPFGFELATGWATNAAEADLELIVRAKRRISLELAEYLLETSRAATVPVRVHLEVPGGSINLIDYVDQPQQLTLYTNYGPRVIFDPWEQMVEERRR